MRSRSFVLGASVLVLFLLPFSSYVTLSFHPINAGHPAVSAYWLLLTPIISY